MFFEWTAKRKQNLLFVAAFVALGLLFTSAIANAGETEMPAAGEPEQTEPATEAPEAPELPLNDDDLAPEFEYLIETYELVPESILLQWC
ncbi:MAG: hypothetical protein MI755_01865 [Sphingomonadales bacterium]|nr:hypothetical protein [Sphingomonadales bacterium]